MSNNKVEVIKSVSSMIIDFMDKFHSDTNFKSIYDKEFKKSKCLQSIVKFLENNSMVNRKTIRIKGSLSECYLEIISRHIIKYQSSYSIFNISAIRYKEGQENKFIYGGIRYCDDRFVSFKVECG